MGIAPVTPRSRRLPARSNGACARATRSRASAVTSSPSCSPTRTSTRRASSRALWEVVAECSIRTDAGPRVLSIGVSLIDAEADSDSAFARADRDMYRDKAEHRLLRA